MFAHRLAVDPWLQKLDGWLGADPYSTAWVAMVPSLSDPHRPAWPDALDYIRDHQLADGGWGDPLVYYPYERTISTLAAIAALHAWRPSDADDAQIAKGLAALYGYAEDSSRVGHEPIGFELVLPRLIEELRADFGDRLPISQWSSTEAATKAKLE